MLCVYLYLYIHMPLVQFAAHFFVPKQHFLPFQGEQKKAEGQPKMHVWHVLESNVSGRFFLIPKPLNFWYYMPTRRLHTPYIDIWAI